MFTKIWTIQMLIIVWTNIIEAGDFCFGKINETYNLDDCYKCETWLRGYIELQSKTITLTNSNIGFYYCQTDKKLLFVLASAKDLSFEFVSNNQKSSKVGVNLTLSCSASIWAGTDMIKIELKIYDARNDAIGSKSYECINAKCDVNLESLKYLDKNGIETYFCSWTFSTISSGIEVKETKTLNKTLRVYMTPRKVHPDKDFIQINETINCTSSSDPDSVYSWTCNGTNNIDWSSEGESLTIYKIGTYNCSCVAKNIIDYKDYSDSWTGIIKALTRDEFEKQFNQELSPGAIAGIVIGVIFLFLLLAIIIYFIKFKSKKQVPKMKGNKMKVAETGTEPLEVVDNQLYSQFPKKMNI